MTETTHCDFRCVGYKFSMNLRNLYNYMVNVFGTNIFKIQPTGEYNNPPLNKTATEVLSVPQW